MIADVPLRLSTGRLCFILALEGDKAIGCALAPMLAREINVQDFTPAREVLARVLDRHLEAKWA